MTNGTDFASVAEASKARIQELNPRVAFKLVPGGLSDKVSQFFAFIEINENSGCRFLQLIQPSHHYRQL